MTLHLAHHGAVPGPRWMGIDVGGTNTKAVLLALQDGRPEVVRSEESATRGDNPLEVLAQVAQIVAGLRAAHPHVNGVGVSLPGSVNRLAGTTGVVPNLPGSWSGTRARDVLRELIGLPVEVINDARAFTLAEARHGAGRGHRVIVGVTLGTGLGNGLVVDGDLLENGSGMSGGDIGHQVIQVDGDPCSCGGRGCVETRASTGTLLRGAGVPTVREAFAAASAGNPTAVAAVEAYIAHLATALANLHTLVCPDVYVIGGGIAAAGEQLLVPLQQAVRSRVRFDDPQRVRLVAAELGPFAGAIGVATLVASTAGGL